MLGTGCDYADLQVYVGQSVGYGNIGPLRPRIHGEAGEDRGAGAGDGRGGSLKSVAEDKARQNIPRVQIIIDSLPGNTENRLSWNGKRAQCPPKPPSDAFGQEPKWEISTSRRRA